MRKGDETPDSVGLDLMHAVGGITPLEPRLLSGVSSPVL